MNKNGDTSGPLRISIDQQQQQITKEPHVVAEIPAVDEFLAISVTTSNHGHKVDLCDVDVHENSKEEEEEDMNRRMGDQTDPSTITQHLPITLKFVDVVHKVGMAASWRRKKPSKWSSRKKKMGIDSAVGGQSELQDPSNSSSSNWKTIIHGVSGHVLSGEMLALMGPSGSGKTTLLNLLSGRLKHHSGSITYNDSPYSKALKQRMGFVTQDDILHQRLTVKETLIYAALLRLPKSLTIKQKKERAMEVIHKLGLDKCQDTVIGGPFIRGISGGERKRVCVGHELLIDPSILFLDEPTSGLDSTIALRIVQILHGLSQGGRTVITTIHQPSSRLFYMFDKLILLAEGRVIYFGKADQAMSYFSSIGMSPPLPMNPADFLLDLASGSHTGMMAVPEESQEKDASHLQEMNGDFSSHVPCSGDSGLQYLYRSYENLLQPLERSKLEQTNPSIEHPKKVWRKQEWSSSWWLQFRVLLLTGMKERRHEYLSYLQITQILAFSFIMGSLWLHSNFATDKGLQDQVGLIFFMSTYWSMYPLFSALHTFPQERTILAKERASDMYRLSACFMGRVLGDGLLNICLPTIFLFIVYFMASLKPTASAFIPTLLTVYATAICSQGLGLALGAAMMNVRKATSIAAVILLSFMLAGGFFVQRLPAFIGWIKNISFISYTFKILIKVQYDRNDMYDCGTALGCRSVELSPALHGIPLNSAVMQACILVLMVVGYHLLAYMFLRRMKLTV